MKNIIISKIDGYKRPEACMSSCKDWVKATLLEELKEMPLWILSAFYHNDTFYVDEIREKLMKHLVAKTIYKAPHGVEADQLYDKIDLKDYIIVFRMAFYHALDGGHF